MATKRRKARRRRSKSAAAPTRRRRTSRGLSAAPRRRRRRRLGAGRMGGVFKLLSDPNIGGGAGGLLALLVKKGVSRFVKNSNIAGAGAVVVGSYLIRKKAPFVAAGATSLALTNFLTDFAHKQSETSLIRKLLGDDAHFVNDNLLSGQQNTPLILSADGSEILPYQLKDMLLSELEDMEDDAMNDEMNDDGMSNSYYMSDDLNDMDDDN